MKEYLRKRQAEKEILDEAEKRIKIGNDMKERGDKFADTYLNESKLSMRMKAKDLEQGKAQEIDFQQKPIDASPYETKGQYSKRKASEREAPSDKNSGMGKIWNKFNKDHPATDEQENIDVESRKKIDDFEMQRAKAYYENRI